MDNNFKRIDNLAVYQRDALDCCEKLLSSLADLYEGQFIELNDYFAIYKQVNALVESILEVRNDE